jgi:hypothetical protein
VPIHKWLFSPISLLGGNFNPRNITHMPAVKISARLKLDENILFLDGHRLICSMQKAVCSLSLLILFFNAFYTIPAILAEHGSLNPSLCGLPEL